MHCGGAALDALAASEQPTAQPTEAAVRLHFGSGQLAGDDAGHNIKRGERSARLRQQACGGGRGGAEEEQAGGGSGGGAEGRQEARGAVGCGHHDLQHGRRRVNCL